MFGVEASYKAFQAAGLMDAMPVVQKDALYIYEVLKTDATRQGHTFISFPDLRQHWHWAQLGHVISDWLHALAFLSENRVIQEERFDSKRNVFLYHNWKAEVDIAEGLKEVMERGIMANRPTWNVDFARWVFCGFIKHKKSNCNSVKEKSNNFGFEFMDNANLMCQQQ